MSGSLAAIRLQGVDSQTSLPDILSPSAVPASYLQLSDIRTKRKRSDEDTAEVLRAGEFRAGGFLPIMPPIRTRHTSREPLVDECLDLVVDCDGKDCQLPQKPTVEECTDQCVVVQCSDPGSCAKVCTQEDCPVEPCDGGDKCAGGFEEFLQCCTALHDPGASVASSENMPQIDWIPSAEDFWNMASQQQQHQTHPFPQANDPHAFPQSMFPEMSRNLGSLDMFPPDASINFTLPPQESPATSLATNQAQVNKSSESTEFKCRWSDCQASFAALNELVGHVNLAHLCGPPLSMPTSGTEQATQAPTKPVAEPLTCHWDHCQIYSDSSALPGPSQGLQPDAAIDLLTNHLFHDHLGLSTAHIYSLICSDAGYDSTQALIADILSRQAREGTVGLRTVELQPQQPIALVPQLPAPSPALTYSTPAPSPPPLSLSGEPSHDCATVAHICHWKGCDMSFDTCAALTEHLNAAHVGGGRGRYNCHWGDCARSGAAGFTSKQKIMRHLQAHTGHRPFTCSECGLHFSEAATLQQHMRRHTQEKPFVCDFPGCGKAFAITGALTIHKRTHNGERPFKCPHCSRAFAESSNLSKHLRTHTGDKPYHCPEPGCGKAFARPDQLQRHTNVHTKKKTPVGSAEPAETGDMSLV